MLMIFAMLLVFFGVSSAVTLGWTLVEPLVRMGRFGLAPFRSGLFWGLFVVLLLAWIVGVWRG